MAQVSADSIITGRLRILESKRMMLGSLRRRLGASRSESLRERVDRLQPETQAAQEAYRTVMLKFGTPETPHYWVVAYGRLLEIGHDLAARLRGAAGDLPPAEQDEIAMDVEVLDAIIESWTTSIRAAMASAVD